MQELSNFDGGLNVAVIGASGGIGRAFVEQFAEQENVRTVYAFYRSAKSEPDSKIQSFPIDLMREETVEHAASLCDAELDIVIIATGILHGEGLAPEKNLSDLSLDKLQDVFAVNTFGPVLVMKHFLPRLRKSHKSVFAALSARVGSIGDNRLGGWYAYRASKAALNMMIKNAAIEVGRKNKNACVIGLHPGTTDTNLSQPFQRNVSADKLFTTRFSVQQMMQVINSVDQDQTGKILAYDGSVIPE